MDSELLRRACERAGFVRLRGKDGPYWVTDGNPFESAGGWQLHEDHPAMPSYAADVLAGMVRDLGLREVVNFGWELVKAGAKRAWVATQAENHRRAGGTGGGR